MVSEAKCDMIRFFQAHGVSIEEASDMIDACRRQYAHELAEKIREAARGRRLAVRQPDRLSASEVFKAEGMDTAANLIDPEAQE